MIRTAREEDLSGLLDLYRELRPSDPELEKGLARERWRQILLNDQTEVIVAEVDGVLAATCSLGINLTMTNGARSFAMIEHVVTAQAFRRMGLARQVLQFAIDLAWQRECYKVMLLSGAQLENAHTLYRSLGFRDEVELGFVLKP